jgi:hypothetical protein
LNQVITEMDLLWKRGKQVISSNAGVRWPN